MCLSVHSVCAYICLFIVCVCVRPFIVRLFVRPSIRSAFVRSVICLLIHHAISSLNVGQTFTKLGSYDQHMARRCESIIFTPGVLGWGQKVKYWKNVSTGTFKNILKLCICNQHWGKHGGQNKIKKNKKQFFLNSKFDIGPWLVELFAIFQLCFRGKCGDLQRRTFDLSIILFFMNVDLNWF